MTVISIDDRLENADWLRRIITLGGQGSGNFGHAGRPGEVGGSSPITLFHGTSSEVVAAIRHDGLVPGKGHGGDDWRVSVGMTNPLAKIDDDDPYASGTPFSMAEIAGRKASVYMTGKEEVAKRYAELAREIHPGSTPVLIKAEIPASQVNLIPDEASEQTMSSYRIEGTIKPEWIKEVRPLDPNEDEDPDDDDLGDFDLRDLERKITIYAVIMVAPPRQRVLGGSGSGNFGHAGRPGEVGGSAPGTVPSGIMDAIHQADGGFTYHAVTGDQPKTGFALSLHKDREHKIAAKDADVVELAYYASKNWDLLSQTDNYLGGWHNPENGQVYLDVSTVVHSAEEAERLGRDAHQEAYFDLSQGKSVPIAYGQTLKAASSYLASHGFFRRPTHVSRPHRAREATHGAGSDAGADQTSASHPRQTYLAPRSRASSLVTAGGPGSGHFGHAGRPGEVGGSASEGTVTSRRTGLPIHKSVLPAGPSEDFRRTAGTTSDEMRAKPLPATLNAAEDTIRDQPNEHGYLVRDGRIDSYYGENQRSFIRLPRDVNYTDTTFTHNHPSGTAFSPTDIALASFHNMREVRAVTAEGTFSMKRVGDQWPHHDLLDKVIQEEISNVTVYLTRRMMNGMITKNEANQQHWTAIWIRVQEQLRKAGGPQIEFNFEKKAA